MTPLTPAQFSVLTSRGQDDAPSPELAEALLSCAHAGWMRRFHRDGVDCYRRTPDGARAARVHAAYLRSLS